MLKHYSIIVCIMIAFSTQYSVGGGNDDNKKTNEEAGLILSARERQFFEKILEKKEKQLRKDVQEKVLKLSTLETRTFLEFPCGAANSCYAVREPNTPRDCLSDSQGNDTP